MTTIAEISSTTDRMRETLAFALATLDSLGLEPWKVEATNGGEALSIYLQDDDAEDAGRALFAALGGHRCQERRQEGVWSIVSCGPSEWDPEKEYARPSVPFGDRMIQVHIACSTTPRAEGAQPAA